MILNQIHLNNINQTKQGLQAGHTILTLPDTEIFYSFKPVKAILESFLGILATFYCVGFTNNIIINNRLLLLLLGITLLTQQII